MRYLRIFKILFLFIIVSGTAKAQTKEQQKAILLKRVIEINHYQPRPVDDKFSQLFYDAFTKSLSEAELTLTADNLKTLSIFSTKIDDELNGKEWKFLPVVTSIIRENIQKNKNDSLQLTDEDLKDFLFELYCDVLANTFDPHTEFMPSEEKEKFETRLSTEGYFFGFALSDNKTQEPEIEKLIPGSAAWKSGELNKGDVLTKISFNGAKPMSLKGLNARQISGLLESPKDARLTMTVRKADGVEKEVTITKEKIRNDENIVKGFVLNGTSKIGYIYLPDFYTTYNGSTGSCANDVAKEIVKLKKENIQGLLFDVRYNGGGSLQEALDLAGIFIDAGPLCIVRDKTGKTLTLKDPNKGTIYDGPMVLLVNGQSASASELVGAVLQDYHRAVIAGSATYGKGTAQGIIPVDSTDGPKDDWNGDFVKITSGKFYRITGLTTQNTGVHPDILLPDLFEGMNYHERAAPSALTADSIPKNNYYKPLSELPLSDLIAKSKARIQNDKYFIRVKEESKLLSDPNRKQAIEKPELTKTTMYTADNNSLDKIVIQADSYRADLNNTWLKRLDTDIYIAEGYSILLDLINHKTP